MPFSKLLRHVGIAVAMAVLVFAYFGYERSTHSPASHREVQISPELSPKSNAVFFFWYGCPHCRHVEEIFRKESGEAKISAALGGGKQLMKIPVPINPTWEMHARLYYALSHLHVSDDTHWYVMNAIQDKNLYTPEKLSSALADIAAFASSHNPGVSVSADQLASDMDSVQTNKDILQAKLLVNAVGLKGVPALLINEKQMIELGNGVGYEDMLPQALSLLIPNT